MHLVRTELDLAFTFLHAAKIAQKREDRQRSRKARDQAELLVKTRLVCTKLQRDSIKSNPAGLETRLNEQRQVSS